MSPAEIEFTGIGIPNAVYRLYGTEDALLYVGFTWNIPVRMEFHAKDKHWWPDVARRTMAWYPSEAEARTAEAIAINTENPLHNRRRESAGGYVPLERRHGEYHKKALLAVRIPKDLRDWAYAEAKRRGQGIGEFVACLIEAERDRMAATLPPRNGDNR